MERKEENFIENAKFVSIAILATSVAIMSNLLQVDFTENNALNQNLQIAVTLFSIVIPYLVWDVYFLNAEKPDEIFEFRIFSILRYIFWLLGSIGIGFAFNFLPNSTSGQTITIFIVSFIGFFIFRLIGMTLHIKRNKKS